MGPDAGDIGFAYAMESRTDVIALSKTIERIQEQLKRLEERVDALNVRSDKGG